MKNIKSLGLFILVALFAISTVNATTVVIPEKYKNTTNVIGIVTCNGEKVPFVSILVSGTTLGTSCNLDGEFALYDIPDGEFKLTARAVGYTSIETDVVIEKGITKTVNFELSEDVVGLDDVVVTADRNETRRKDAMTVVSSISPDLFQRIGASTLSEGLNFTPGLRMENNCQNCGFTQVRMNGLEGPYSQILINSRPIFSGLAGVYGLELIPSNMIERVEVVRGGGSALYGSNAIAGTINLITKDPIHNTFGVDVNSQIVGVGTDSDDPATEYNGKFNVSFVNKTYKVGASVYAYLRHSDEYDANNDGYSERSRIDNQTIGMRGFYRTSARSKLTYDLFHISEDRRGGNKLDLLEHEADIAEAVDHKINTVALNWDQLFSESNKLSIFGSMQNVNRDSYYGANQDPSAYGNTTDLSYSLGTQYNHSFNYAFFAPSKLVAGIEMNGDLLEDSKLPYVDEEGNVFEETMITDQDMYTLGAFVQNDWSMEKFKFGVGLRIDNYHIDDNHHETEPVEGVAFSPRLNAMYNFSDQLQARVSYSHGFRAPQVFDEDLHIETSGARKVLHANDPDLKQEESRSISGSLSYNVEVNSKLVIDALAEGFYTRLLNPFVKEYGTPDSTGTVIYTRTNAENGAYVGGANLEFNLSYAKLIKLQTGFTIQKSIYDDPQEFDEVNFFRTPDNYGFFSFSVTPHNNWDISMTGNYTGNMLVPYFGTETDPEVGELRESDSFFDLGAKIAYKIPVKKLGTLELFCGMKNIFNEYQSDFDSGVDRDPAYIYGPMLPRTLNFGLKIGNI